MDSVKIAEPGEVIFSEGDEGDLMYVLLEGAVELKKKVEKGETILKTIESPNEFFGEMALIDGRPRSATAVAARRSRLLMVDGSTFESMILSNGKFALKIIKVLSERVRNSNDKVEELIAMPPRERIMFGMADFARRSGERTHDGGLRVKVEEMRRWINGRLGISLDEIDACLFKLVKAETVSYSAAGGAQRDQLVLPTEFLRENDRRV